MQGVDRGQVIVADADSRVRRDLSEMLTHRGYEVVGEAGDGMSTVNLARARHPDLVVLDLELPGMNGVQAAALIARDSIAAVILTAPAQHQVARRAAEAGVVAFVVKPVGERKLFSALEVGWRVFTTASRLRQIVRDLQKEIATQKALERAKGILMDQGMTATDALATLGNLAMRSGQSVEDAAGALVTAHHLGMVGSDRIAPAVVGEPSRKGLAAAD